MKMRFRQRANTQHFDVDKLFRRIKLSFGAVFIENKPVLAYRFASLSLAVVPMLVATWKRQPELDMQQMVPFST